MISIQIDDVKNFMNKLLKQDIFDRFLIHSLELQTNYLVNIDGQLLNTVNEIDIDDLESNSKEAYIPWRFIREDILFMLKKNKTPKLLKISFLMNENATINIINKVSNLGEEKNITGFILNIIYENNTLKIITATNYKTFTLDKSYEKYFDESIIKFLNRNSIE